jgi:beta-lactamase superfamily II metal-dependent hydrolase
MTVPAPVPAAKLQPGDFSTAISDEDLVYFLLNVGDADCQLLVLPKSGGRRRGIVVDVGKSGKLPALIAELEGIQVLAPANDVRDIALVVATHPHLDHIGGMPQFLHRFGDRISEYWDSGYRHPIPSYFNVMRELEDRRDQILYSQPTSGMLRFFDQVRVTVLSPAVALRNRYDSYGVDPNNSSVSLKIEYPVTRAVEADDRRFLESREREAGAVTRMILGGDAQLTSWSHVMTDFPDLLPTESPVLRALGMRQGFVPLRAEVLKVPHHGSKLGTTVELAAAIEPRLALVSSVGGGGKHNFPHGLTQDALREARTPISKSGVPPWPRPDHEIGIHYTSARDTNDRELGSIALVVKPSGRRIHLWRFMDGDEDNVVLQDGERYVP